MASKKSGFVNIPHIKKVDKIPSFIEEEITESKEVQESTEIQEVEEPKVPEKKQEIKEPKEIKKQDREVLLNKKRIRNSIEKELPVNTKTPVYHEMPRKSKPSSRDDKNNIKAGIYPNATF